MNVEKRVEITKFIKDKAFPVVYAKGKNDFLYGDDVEKIVAKAIVGNFYIPDTVKVGKYSLKEKEAFEEFVKGEAHAVKFEVSMSGKETSFPRSIFFAGRTYVFNQTLRHVKSDAYEWFPPTPIFTQKGKILKQTITYQLSNN